MMPHDLCYWSWLLIQVLGRESLHSELNGRKQDLPNDSWHAQPGPGQCKIVLASIYYTICDYITFFYMNDCQT